MTKKIGGRDAYLEWAYEEEDDAVSTDDDMSEHDNALGEDIEDEDEDDEDDGSGKLVQVESPAQLVSRGMPNYSTWELKKLQVGLETPYVHVPQSEGADKPI